MKADVDRTHQSKKIPTTDHENHEPTIAERVFSAAQDAAHIQKKFYTNNIDLIDKRVNLYTNVMLGSGILGVGSFVLKIITGSLYPMVGLMAAALLGLSAFNSYQNAATTRGHNLKAMENTVIHQFQDNVSNLKLNGIWDDDARSTYHACLWMLMNRKDINDKSDRKQIIQNFSMLDHKSVQHILTL